MYICVVLVGHVVIFGRIPKKGGALICGRQVGVVLCDIHPSCWVLCPSKNEHVFVPPDNINSVAVSP